MPRLGSLTQRPRQPTRFGANTWALAGQGFTRLAAVTGQEFAPAPRLQFTPASEALGHYRSQVERLQAPQFTGTFRLAPGVTRDSTGTPLANCDVYLFRVSAFNELIRTTTSDGSGNYTFQVSDNSGAFWAVAYKPGSPDVAGVTARNLVAVSV